jgi:hypothetical protein
LRGKDTAGTGLWDKNLKDLDLTKLFREVDLDSEDLPLTKLQKPQKPQKPHQSEFKPSQIAPPVEFKGWEDDKEEDRRLRDKFSGSRW